MQKKKASSTPPWRRRVEMVCSNPGLEREKKKQTSFQRKGSLFKGPRTSRVSSPRKACQKCRISSCSPNLLRGKLHFNKLPR